MNPNFWQALKPVAPMAKPGSKSSAPGPEPGPAPIFAATIASSPAPAAEPQTSLAQRSVFNIATDQAQVAATPLQSRLATARADAALLDEHEKLLAAIEREISGIAMDTAPVDASQSGPDPADKPGLGTLQRHNRARLIAQIQRLEAIHRSLL